MSKATLLTDAGVIKNETTNSANTATRVGEMFEDIINETFTTIQTVTQQTSESTAVTINGEAGIITSAASQINANSGWTFTVNNTSVTTDSLILLTFDMGSNVTSCAITMANLSNGSFDVAVRNNSAINISFTTFKVNFKVFN
jgi:hypothetical protein